MINADYQYTAETLSGKIARISADDNYKFRGIIIRTDDQLPYTFTSLNWENHELELNDIKVDDEVEFELRKPNAKGMIYPQNIRFKKNIEPSFLAYTEVNHSHGDLYSFVFMDWRSITYALTGILSDLDITNESSSQDIRETISSTYNNLCDDDFTFMDNHALTFPTGFEKDGEPVYLYCTKNYNYVKPEWACARIFFNNRALSSSVFEIINADWYDILSDFKILLPSLPADTTVKTITDNIQQRCFPIEDTFIWLNNGVVTNSEFANKLYAPTGYYLDDGKELYMLCSRRKGIKGFGWYYDLITYENAPIDIYDKKDWMEMWSVFDKETIYESLASQTLEETWSFGNRNDYGILRNYLNYIFAHQLKNNAVKYSSDGKYAAFNTGLPEKSTFKHLYAIFEKIDFEGSDDLHPLYFKQKYKFIEFTRSEIGGTGKILKTQISPLPSPPKFFKARSSTVWELEFDDNNQITMPGFDDIHILIQRCDRLPLAFYARTFGSKKLQYILRSELPDSQKYKEIRELLRPIQYKEDRDAEIDQVYEELYGNLKKTIEKAIHRLSWNWRAVVPCYNPELEKPCFLLPVSFCDMNKPDRALIASIDKVNDKIMYNIHTVVPLEWAYLDARLVCRPESEWLAPDNFTYDR